MTENNNNMFKQVYWSTADRPFEVWFAPQEVKVEYPFTEVVPDPSIKAPIFVWEGQKWVENTEVSQAAQLNDLKQIVDQIKNANSNNANDLNKFAKNQAKLLQMLTPKIAGKPTVPTPPTATVSPTTTTPTTPNNNETTIPNTNGGAQ
ncbi:hypothetical protein F5ESL0236_07895 [Lactobacillus sp. ESL0236]|uniref:hypothetical protein n=1 Tax=unclassified Lactobacillus TaxID=2620435 RepID=UPI000EFB6D55|nr:MULTISPECIES: hypothetical protein [unclassified Lactobacillus]RMC36914.1 hypothetical protein F5ESL0237_07970 [Lactobacillus sp. ESL0237]RMC42593.1 hypothetical protein F5ESL0234_07855 [Lactobacillus sp. ESL0234]RMC43259.1 hypothetical protein F5ESL0236_07895 [Lactobacillus sp. ESL0236]